MTSLHKHWVQDRSTVQFVNGNKGAAVVVPCTFERCQAQTGLLCVHRAACGDWAIKNQGASGQSGVLGRIERMVVGTMSWVGWLGECKEQRKLSPTMWLEVWEPAHSAKCGDAMPNMSHVKAAVDPSGPDFVCNVATPQNSQGHAPLLWYRR